MRESGILKILTIAVLAAAVWVLIKHLHINVTDINDALPYCRCTVQHVNNSLVGDPDGIMLASDYLRCDFPLQPATSQLAMRDGYPLMTCGPQASCCGCNSTVCAYGTMERAPMMPASLVVHGLNAACGNIHAIAPATIPCSPDMAI
jgi:hypothetical protein